MTLITFMVLKEIYGGAIPLTLPAIGLIIIGLSYDWIVLNAITRAFLPVKKKRRKGIKYVAKTNNKLSN